MMSLFKILWPRSELGWITFKTTLRAVFVILRPFLLVTFAIVARVKRNLFAEKVVASCNNGKNHRPCGDTTDVDVLVLVTTSPVL